MKKNGDLHYVDVDVHFADRQILHRVTMAASSGSFVGVIGPNGSGKSTILRCLYRALSPSAGVIRVDGRDIHSISMRDNARHVAALTQTAGSHLDFTVTDVVRTGRLPHRAALAIGHTADDARVCAQAMADADVTHLKHRSFCSLSGGETQRVLIARAFAQQPRILVLDEPTNHLDVRHQYGVLTSARDRGVTVLAALHDLNLAAQFCDELVLVSDGRVVRSGPPETVLTVDHITRWFGIACHVYPHPRLGVPQILFDERLTS
jgi:iron complex transport system ATP-binding protein